MSIVQLSRFVFLCRSFQATAFIFYQSFVRLSRTFYFFCFASLITSVSSSATAYLDYHIQTALSTTFLFFQTLPTFRIIRIVSSVWNRNLFVPAAVPPPRLCMLLNRSLFSVVFPAVPQRLSYHIIPVWNCQCFFYYLYNSENFCNSNYSDNYCITHKINQIKVNIKIHSDINPSVSTFFF